MDQAISREDWGFLTDRLKRAGSELAARRLATVKQCLSDFSTTSAMFGLHDMADTARTLQEFLVNKVTEEWRAGAATALSFAISELVQKMNEESYSPALSAFLGEVLLYLYLYTEEVHQAVTTAHTTAPAGELQLSPLADPTSAASPADAGPPVSLPREDEGSIALTEITEAVACNMDVVACYRNHLALDPSSRVFAFLAEELCARSRWQEAVQTCRHGLGFHPQHLRGRVLLGWALAELGRTEEAEHVLSEVQRDFEKNAAVYRLLGEIWEKRGNTRLATHYFNLYVHLQVEAGEASDLETQVEEQAVPSYSEEQEAPAPMEDQSMLALGSLAPQIEVPAEPFSVPAVEAAPEPAVTEIPRVPLEDSLPVVAEPPTEVTPQLVGEDTVQPDSEAPKPVPSVDTGEAADNAVLNAAYLASSPLQPEFASEPALQPPLVPTPEAALSPEAELVPSQQSAAIDVLEGLLEKYGAEREAPETKISLFSEEDRRLFESLLRKRT